MNDIDMHDNDMDHLIFVEIIKSCPNLLNLSTSWQISDVSLESIGIGCFLLLTLQAIVGVSMILE